MSEQHTGDSENCTDNRDPNLGVSISDKASKGAWSDVDFSDLNPETYPFVWLDCEQWMGHREKRPFAPWGDRNHPLPCAEDDAQTCPYTSKWDFDPDEFDVLIGHYSHAHKPKVTTGRAVVFDEFTGTYETILDSELQGAVSCWLKATDDVPVEAV